MGWSVEVRLRPESCLIEMESKLYNFTDFPQRFYYWVNAAVPIYPETQFIYPPSTHRLYTHPPMDISLIAHIDYPVHQGRDISFFKNISQHFPVFAENMKEDFFGVYHHNLGVGLVHIADHSLVKGRKIWMFGNARDGKIWIDLLADSGIDYCELQSGPFSLQSDYRMLAPGKIHLQKDFWYPVTGLKGFNAASKELAANIKIEGRNIEILINSTKKLEHLKMQLKINQHIKSNKEVSVIPLTLKSVVFDLPYKLEGKKMEIDFLDEFDNKILCYLSYQSKKSPKRENAKVNLDNKHSLDSIYLKGRYLEEQGYPEKALEMYSQGAKTVLKAKISHARLIATSGKFKEALIELGEVLSINKENPEALYLSGICLKYLKRYTEAEKQFSFLIDNELWMKKAFFYLTKISIIQKNYIKGLSMFSQLIEFYPANSCVLSLYALCLRKTGDLKEAQEVLNKAKETFHFAPLIYGESFLLKKSQNKSNIFKILSIRNCQQIIEIVCRYMEINEFKEALEILNIYIEKKKNELIIPLLFYYKGYLEKELGKENKSKKSFVRGKSSKIKWDFVFRLESEVVLKTAIKSNANDYKAFYHLGNMLAFKGRWNESVSLWRKVSGDNLSCSLRNQGVFYWKKKNEPGKAIKKYKEAVSIKPCGVKTIWEYDRLLEEMSYSQERIRALKKNKEIIYGDRRLLLRLASAFIATSHCEEALKILKANKFPLCEGKVLPRLLYEESCCKLGDKFASEKNLDSALTYYKMPLKYPENLGVGKPSRNMEAEWWYRTGAILKEIGDNKEAEKYFKNGAKKGDGIDIEFHPLKNIILEHPPDTINVHLWINEFFRILCLREIGEVEQGEKILNEMNFFIDNKVAEGRENEIEVQFIKSLLFHIKGIKKKTVELPNGFPCNKIPYCRINDFLTKGLRNV